MNDCSTTEPGLSANSFFIIILNLFRIIFLYQSIELSKETAAVKRNTLNLIEIISHHKAKIAVLRYALLDE